MNTSSTNKVIKKKLKIKQKVNKSSNIETAGFNVNYSLQNQQQPEEDPVRKKLKVKQISNIDTDGAVIGNTLHQKPLKKEKDEQKLLKKKLKVKPIYDPQPRKQQQNENKLQKKNFKEKQKYIKSTNIETTGVVIEHKIQKAEQQQQGEKMVINENNVKLSSSISSNIRTAGTTDQQGVEYYHKKAYIFMKTLKRDYRRLSLIYNSCLKAEQERERRNVEEIDELKRKYNQMQVERTNIKRKRWCRYCESEATYLSSAGTNFYCSRECEQKQNDLVSAMENNFTP